MTSSKLSWDEYYMGVAVLTSFRSKDPNTKVGCCIVNKYGRIISTGYNGFPQNADNDSFPWTRDGSFLDTKYPFVCHAELNAILNAQSDLHGARLYVTLFPCNECAKAVSQSGITEVVYGDNKYSDTDIVKASKKILESCGVKLRYLKPIGLEIL